MYTDIQDIDCPAGGADLFATALSDREITIWSFTDRRRVAVLTTGMDFGGHRLALVPATQPLVAAAAYHVHGVAAYDIASGRTVWTRRDLKRTQQLTWIPGASGCGEIAVGTDDRSLRILDAATGETRAILRAVRDIYVDTPYELMVAVSSRDVQLRSRSDWRLLWRRDLVSFAVLDAAISTDAVAVAEAGGPLRCFDLQGSPQWEYRSADGHVMNVCWCAEADEWLAIERDLRRKCPDTLLAFDRQGHVVRRFPLDALCAEFWARGTRCVTSEGQVLDTETGGVVWDFRKDAS